MGGIVGGVLGGVILLVIAALAGLLCCARRKTDADAAGRQQDPSGEQDETQGTVCVTVLHLGKVR